VPGPVKIIPARELTQLRTKQTKLMKINEKIGACRDIGRYRQILRIMKLTILIITVFLMQVSASSNAQITLSARKESLRKVLKSISKQSGYDLVYTDQDLSKALPVNLNLENASIENALSACFEGQPLVYKILDKTVMVKKKEMPSFLDRIIDRFAAVDVRGRVLDEAGNPLVGATIQVKGKALAYKTNDKGEFEIKGVDEDAVLLVSYVGFKTLEISLKDAVMPLEIKLNVATGELEEVKVVYNTGYQELNKERSTGSFVQIDNELFNRAVGTNVLDRILNVTSGLINKPISGSFGTNNDIVIRGFSTISANKSALIVVDNFPYEGDLSILNPNDIESVTVLKDAAAASIWGVRAGNGVIVITTKKGRFNQPTNIGFNSNVAIGAKPDLFYIPYISSEDMIDYEKNRFVKGVYNDYDDLYPSFALFPVLPQSIEILLKARRENKGTIGYNALNDPLVTAKLNELGNHDVRNDINKYLLQNSINQQYALNLSGGGGNFNYYSSIGYDKNKDSNIKEDNSRLSLNFINTWRPIKNLEVTSSIVHTRIKRKNNDSYSNLLPTSVNQISPYTLFADKSGFSLSIPKKYRTTYIDTAYYPALMDWHYEPLEDFKYIDNRIQNHDTRLSAVLKYTVRSWLKAEFQYQNQVSQSNRRDLYGNQSFLVRDNINSFMNKDASGKLVYPYPLGDQMNLGSTVFKAWNIRGNLRFDQQFGNHHLSGFAGIELREVTSESDSRVLYGFDPETYISTSVGNQVFPTRPSGARNIMSSPALDGNLTRNGSFFGNSEYNYKGKYLVTISGRIDQSNFFGLKANLRRVPLWSAGIAWNLHMEDFYNIDWLYNLKLRASYGFSGNTNSGASSYARLLYTNGSEGVPPRGISFASIISPNNPQLRWERVKTINTGFDFILKNNILSGSIDFYQKYGLDLLSDVLTDPTTGFATFTGNQASTKGNGFDIYLNIRNFNKGSFEWNTIWNFGFNTDKITSYKGDPPAEGALNGLFVDKPLLSIFSYNWAGLDPENGNPRIYINGTISAASDIANIKTSDIIFNGSQNPKMFGSFINNFRWKQISISANITYRLGHYFRRSTVDYVTLLNSGWNGHIDYASRWVKPGDELITDIPSLPTNIDFDREYVFQNSSVLVEKADHIRLQDIKLNFNLTKVVFKSLPFKQISLYLYAANLGIIWRANNKGLDPDAYTFGSMPVPKTISFGLNANF